MPLQLDAHAPDHPPGPWFHNLHLPDGSRTAPGHPLGDFPSFKWEALEEFVPASLDGKTALDVGCNAGFYAFELAKRGAAVTALEIDEQYLTQARWAAGRFGLEERIAFRNGSVYDLARDDVEYDVVWFMGVLYHLRHPLLALDILAERTAAGGTLVFQTLTMPGAEPVDPPADLRMHERDRLTGPGWPRMAFLERRFEQDPTNWWAADDAACRAMLRSAGFAVTAAVPDQEVLVCERLPDDGDDYVTGLRRAECRAATGRAVP